MQFRFYYLNILIWKSELDDGGKSKILTMLIKKCQSRDIYPSLDSIDNPEVKLHSASEWHTLKLKLEELPDFDS